MTRTGEVITMTNAEKKKIRMERKLEKEIERLDLSFIEFTKEEKKQWAKLFEEEE